MDRYGTHPCPCFSHLFPSTAAETPHSQTLFWQHGNWTLPAAHSTFLLNFRITHIWFKIRCCGTEKQRPSKCYIQPLLPTLLCPPHSLPFFVPTNCLPTHPMLSTSAHPLPGAECNCLLWGSYWQFRCTLLPLSELPQSPTHFPPHPPSI